MRVLWFTNVAFPDALKHFGGSDFGSGGWLWGLASALRQHTDVTLGVATAFSGGQPMEVTIDGISHYRLAVAPKKYARAVTRELDQDFVDSCLAAISKFKPDLVHIHGTEQTYGLLSARGLIPVPSVISLQGILAGIYPEFLGRMTPRQLAGCHGVMNLVFRQGIAFEWMRWKRRIVTERQILMGNSHFIGRTLWDKAQLNQANTRAVYYECAEVLRSPFYCAPQPVPKADGPTILATFGAYPLKGTHVLLNALSILRRSLPGVKLVLAGGEFRRSRWFRGYWTFLDSLIQKLDLGRSIELRSILSATDYLAELKRASALVVSSLIENSSNSVCEAMLVGTPCVCSYVGGIPSLISNEQTGLLFPPGDPVFLAEQLQRVLSTPELAKELSQSAQRTARERHDPLRIAQRTNRIYESVLRGCPLPKQ